MTRDKILAELPKLDKSALKGILTVIQGLLGDTVTHEPDDATKWLYEALCGVLGITYTSTGTLPRPKGFAKNAPVAIAFMNNTFQGAMTNRVKAIGLMRYLLGLLSDDLKRQQVPVTRNTLANNLGRLPEVFENSFPHYHKSGVANLVMQAILGK